VADWFDSDGGDSAKGLKRPLGPLTLGGWLLAGGGAVVVWILWRRYEADKAANAAAGGGTGPGLLTGAGGTIPTPGAGTVTGNVAPFSSYSDWLQATVDQIVSGGGIDAGQALDAITTWLGGGCVSKSQYSAISNVLSSTSIGLPPGWGTSIPPLTVCSTATSGSGSGTVPTTPSTPAPAPPTVTGSNENASLTNALIAEMTTNGEHVIDEVFQPTNNTMYYLTNKGGIYTVGNGFYGSVFSLGSEFVGTPVKVTLNSMGGYTIWNQYGQSYNFGPQGTGADYAGATGGKGAT
jgi:hypothetical protein